jgi:GT2 family glycosyltransferase
MPDPSAPAGPRYAVIIPHYNDVRRLVRCLAALEPQVGPDTEVVVADNGSTESLDAVRAACPWARIVIEPTKGAGPARNRGVAETTAPWILFIDSDCLPAPDWLAVGKRLAAEGKVIGGRVDVFHETPPPMSGAEAFETVFAFDMRGYLETKKFLGSGNLVTSRAVFEATGGFRPAVSEDVDWSQRAAAAGFTLAYADDFAVGHPSRSDWPALERKWRRVTEEGFALRGQGAAGRLKWAVKALAMPASILVHVPKVLGARKLAPGERISALATLGRVRLARMIWMLRQAATGRTPLR